MKLLVAQPVYRSFLQELSKTLSPFEFRKSGERFYRDTCQSRSIIQFQKSRSSTADEILFTANIAQVYFALLDPDYDDVSKITGSDGHIRWRMGDFLEQKHDKWWQIGPETEIKILTKEIVEIITIRVLPRLNEFLTEESILKLWKTGASPGISKMQRDKYVQLLKKRITES